MAGINLQILIDESIDIEECCIVCKKPLEEDKAVVGFRIRETRQNVLKYGEEVIYHWMNTRVVSDVICSNEFSLTWEGKKGIERTPAFIESICQEIKRAKEECIENMKEVLSGKQKRKKKSEI